ncbi:MAG: 4'-phosphopantetheinyl transferase superfamily protein [Deltaproteobacteria bacterium]|nr:4'-phosphopantetheinyl transferase superfamily protein [Deltaproteobacteria bacterium]
MNIPDQPAPIPEDVQLMLHPEEWEYAEKLRGYRQIQFIGGRLALHDAGRLLGVSAAPSLPDHWGAPIVPQRMVGSISHKRTLAVAMMARPEGQSLGVDLETYGPPRPRVASKVLTPEELRSVAELPESRQWISTLVRFSIKEALYKALHPHLRRYVDFQEVSVFPDLQGGASIDLHLTPPGPPLQVAVRYDWLHGYLLTSARVRRVG